MNNKISQRHNERLHSCDAALFPYKIVISHNNTHWLRTGIPALQDISIGRNKNRKWLMDRNISFKIELDDWSGPIIREKYYFRNNNDALLFSLSCVRGTV